MKILNYIFLDDYFKLDFESESGFKIVIGYKLFNYYLKFKENNRGKTVK